MLRTIIGRDEGLEISNEERNSLRKEGFLALIRRMICWIRTLRNSSSTEGSISHISVTRVMQDRRTPWLRSVRRFFALSVKWSVISGTFLMTRKAHKAA